MATMMKQAESRLRTGFALDRRYAFLMGIPQEDKESAILDVVRIFREAGVPYAIMGGVAVQIHTQDPRTTLDLDIALKSMRDIPVEALVAAGFTHDGTHKFSDNWRAPGKLPRRQRTAVQFSADALTSAAVDRAGTITVGGDKVPVVTPLDLVLLKIAAALEPRRRKSKRISDYGDVVRLLEEHADLEGQLPDIQADLDTIKTML